MDNKTIHTAGRYGVLAAVFLILGLVLVFLPDKSNKKEMLPEHMLAKLVDNSRFISTDEVAEKLIGNDPSIQLIDVRRGEEFDKGSLPGAINIPLDEVLGEEALKVFKRKAYDKVIFGNSDTYADQAWMLLSREMMKRTYIMKGGLNHWVQTIINPVEPNPASPIEDFELYDFRVGASRYFSGQNSEYRYSENTGSAKPKPVVKQKKAASAPVLPAAQEEEEEDEGC